MPSPEDLVIRPVGPGDDALLRAFFDGVGGADLTFLPVADPEAVATRPGGHHHVALTPGLTGRVVGFCGIVPGEGWSRHAGRLGVVVDPGVRGSGLGSRLVIAALRSALESGLEKVWVEVRSDQQPVLALFSSLGFQPEALLTDQLRDPDGTAYDLIVLAHRVDDVRALVSVTGLDEADGA